VDRALRDQQTARRDLAQARPGLAAAHAIPTQNPCEGCHRAKAAAITAAQAAVAAAEARAVDAGHRMSLCEAAADILGALAQRLLLTAHRDEAGARSSPAGSPACRHSPRCPAATAPDHDAARTIATHPEQGWSLLCNGIVLFDDTGELLPGGCVVAPRRASPARRDGVPAGDARR